MFVALGETVHIPLGERFFDFPFPSYSRFRKKKKRLTRQKVFPLPTVRALSASNSPTALSSQALRACALRAGLMMYTFGSGCGGCCYRCGGCCGSSSRSTWNICLNLNLPLLLTYFTKAGECRGWLDKKDAGSRVAFVTWWA